MTPMMRSRPDVRSVTADVVVVGSGGAGLSAACAAARAGADVVVITKGRAGRANATAYAGGGFTVSPPAGSAAALGEEALTPEKHFRLSLETGRLLGDPRLLEEMCRRGPEALRELEREYGVRFDWSSGGCSVHRFGRPPLLGGFGLTGPLVSYLRRAGVRLFEGTVVTRIMVEDGRVEGVLAVSPGPAGVDLIAFAAPAVVVATGGGGAVYGRTDNPPRMTGDGYRLLRRAGAALVDMEFVQFYPLGVAEPGLPARLLDTSLLDFVRLTDETGAEPLAGRLEEWGLESWARANLFARDRLAVALARHAAAGHRLFLRTDEVRGDAVPGEYLEHLRGSFLRSFDLFSRPLRVAPTQHYFCGGAVFNERGEVLDAEGRPIPGLHACGETTGGVDGANRLGGNALTNIVVFGLAAGRAAAAYARGRSGRASVTRAPWSSAAREEEERLSRWGVGDRGTWPGAAAPAGGRGRVGRRGAGRPHRLRRELHALADRLLGPVRSGPKLKEALAGLEDLGRRVPDLEVTTPSDLLLALEMESAVATATYVARSALERTESRGSHFREDFPAEDPDWEKHVVLG